MNITQVLHKLKKFTEQQKFVNTVTFGEAYDTWNGQPDIKYGAVNFEIPQTTINENMQQMQIYIWYADRLAQDHSNEYEIRTTGEAVLTNIVNYLTKIGDVIDGYTINFFSQKFADDLAGAYLYLTFETERDLEGCLMDEYEDENEDLIERLKEAIREYEAENAELALLLKEILFRLEGEYK